MPMFFFHARNAAGPIDDPEGLDLPSLDAARREAIRSIRSILSDEIKRGRCDLRGHIDIADANDVVLAQVKFGEAVKVILDRGAKASR